MLKYDVPVGAETTDDETETLETKNGRCAKFQSISALEKIDSGIV